MNELPKIGETSIQVTDMCDGWFDCEIIAHHQGKAVFFCRDFYDNGGEGYGAGEPCEFRKRSSLDQLI